MATATDTETKFDVTLANSRQCRVNINGVADLVDFLGLIDGASEGGFITANVEITNPHTGSHLRWARGLLRAGDIVTVAEVS